MIEVSKEEALLEIVDLETKAKRSITRAVICPRGYLGLYLRDHAHDHQRAEDLRTYFDITQDEVDLAMGYHRE